MEEEYTHRQARELVYSVYQYFQQEARKADKTTRRAVDSVAKCQEWAVEACKIGFRSVQRIVSEAKSSLNICSSVALRSLETHYQRKKPVKDVGDFNKNVMRRMMLCVHVARDFPATQELAMKIKDDAEF
jgi:hypothetical protein